MSDPLGEFTKHGQDASYYFAGDSGKEWPLGYKSQRAAMSLWHEHPELHEQMRVVARKFLWSLTMELDNEQRRAGK